MDDGQLSNWLTSQYFQYIAYGRLTVLFTDHIIMIIILILCFGHAVHLADNLISYLSNFQEFPLRVGARRLIACQLYSVPDDLR